MGELSQSEANLVLGKLFVLWDFQGQPSRQRIIPADDCFVWIERLSSLFCTAFPPYAPLELPSRSRYLYSLRNVLLYSHLQYRDHVKLQYVTKKLDKDIVFCGIDSNSVCSS